VRVIDACSDCGLGACAHYCDCPRIAQAVAQSAPQPTAYDRAQAELVRREEVQQLRDAVNVELKALSDALNHVDRAAFERIVALERRAGALETRIEALEAEVARLKAYSRVPKHLCMRCGVGFNTDDGLAAHQTGCP